jgi:hypothetical protein
MNIDQEQAIFSDRKLQAELRDWYDISQFDHPTAITLTMKQGIPGTHGWIRIDKITASQNLRYFLNRLNKKVFGSASHRHKRKLNCLPVIEHDEVRRMHYHLLLDCPEHLSDQAFETLVRTCWRQTAWASEQVHYEPSANAGWLLYISKFATKLDFIDHIDLENCHYPTSHC